MGCAECRSGVLCEDARRLLRELVEKEARLVERGEMTPYRAGKMRRRLEALEAADAAREAE